MSYLLLLRTDDLDGYYRGVDRQHKRDFRLGLSEEVLSDEGGTEECDLRFLSDSCALP